MFVRRNRNRSGTISVQIVQKNSGKVKIVKTIGVSDSLKELDKLSRKAEAAIPQITGQATLFPLTKRDANVKNFLEELQNAQIHTIGPELIFGKLFNRIGFNQIKDELFRHLVIARLAYPGSKLKTVDYLQRYRGINLSVDSLYRFLDRLHKKHKEQAEQIAFEHTKRVLNNNLTVVFYDLTTLYFDGSDEDDLRKIGFSKDGKFHKPQIMLGLLVGMDGYPIGYELFAGNVFEGHTLIPALKKFQYRFKLDKPIIIADAALLNKDNIKALENKHYQYILGGRIKNETNTIKQQILKHDFSQQDVLAINKNKDTRLIVSYSEKRARKDIHNRKRGLKRLEKKLKTRRLTKDKINNRGYNKYLKLKGKIEVAIDYDKFKKDAEWDGLKGYLTNANLSETDIINNYQQLWQIEKAFRISKTDLKIRPIYHRLQERIDAHICIAFTAYTIYKELERVLYKHKVSFGVKRAAELTHTMYQLEYILPESLHEEKILLKMDQEQKLLFNVVHNK